MVLASWMPQYKHSTRAMWDECVDPLICEDGSDEPRIDGVHSFVSLLQHQQKHQQGGGGGGGGDGGDLTAVGPSAVFISHSLDNPFADLVDSVHMFTRRCGKDLDKFYVWLDGFSLPKYIQQCDQEFLGSTFREIISHCELFCGLYEPWSEPVPLYRSWCTFHGLELLLHTYMHIKITYIYLRQRCASNLSLTA